MGMGTVEDVLSENAALKLEVATLQTRVAELERRVSAQLSAPRLSFQNSKGLAEHV